MKPLSLLITLLIFVIVGIYIYQYYEETKFDEFTRQSLDLPIAENGTSLEEPEIRHPIPQKQRVSSVKTEQNSDIKPKIEEVFPSLEESDETFVLLLHRYFATDSLSQLFFLNAIVHRFVVTVDNLPGKNIPTKYRLTKPVGGALVVYRNELGAEFIDSDNYQRYKKYVQFLDAVEVSWLVSIYVKYYALFQEAYENLGYPDKYFNDRLIEVIEHLLESPIDYQSIEVIQPSVFYKLVDKDLEQLTGGQKILLRIGNENARRVQNKLNDIKREILRVSQNKNTDE